ncbi:zinc metallopeptidase [Deinococcus radiophilus]|uniref:Zinc metallopeptidase n=1 Tax=Deinococcus radiophilus TaxID=32062 RepID=A0A431W1T8_9DEIO|nr:zinc metallopeptidase [Deinococcus radiophilus]RTR29457.1 zinc metallopeptidase [Deinococcus radiophilus]UFA50708.1 zinc metallopeptidase [Deinococcus radiophilus]
MDPMMYGTGGGSGYFPLIIGLMVLSFVVQFYLKNVYGKWMNVRNSAGLTGAEVARRMLDDAGLQHVPVKMTPGELSDHYDPIKDEVYLSEANFRNPSVAGAAVAAHEVGHAIQDKISMPALVARGKLAVPLSIGSNLAPWMFLAGLLLSLGPLMWLGVILFGAALLFHLITLPVEFDASRRAMAYMKSNGLVAAGAETKGAQTVLTAAALTYVLAFAMALAQFLHFLNIARSSD